MKFIFTYYFKKFLYFAMKREKMRHDSDKFGSDQDEFSSFLERMESLSPGLRLMEIVELEEGSPKMESFLELTFFNYAMITLPENF